MIDKNSADYLIGYTDGFKEGEKKVREQLRREFEIASRSGGMKKDASLFPKRGRAEV